MDQHLYRSGVGTLLYLIKHSRPDICNGVRELSKVMDRGNSAHFEEMLRVVKYVYDTKELSLELKLKVSKIWELVTFSDSDWGGDKDDRKSINGYGIFLWDAL